MTKKKTYTKAFKTEAVRLLETTDQTGQAIARELGIKRNQLYKWREELKTKGEFAFQGPGRRPLDQSDKVTRLERENARLKEELEILKKAAPNSTKLNLGKSLFRFMRDPSYGFASSFLIH